MTAVAAAVPMDAGGAPTPEFRSRRTRIIAGLALAFAVLLVSGTITYRSNSRFAASADWVEHTYQVIREIDDLIFAISLAETEQRRFLLSADAQFVEAYARSAAKVPPLLQSLGVLTRDNPRQQAALPELIALVERTLLTLDSNVRRTQAGSPADLPSVQRSWAEVDRIRALGVTMKREEERRLVERSAQRRLDFSETRRVVILGNLSALLLVLFAGTLLLREIAGHRRTSAQLERFFTLSLDMLCIAGTDGYFKRLNPAFSRTLGYSTAELLARPFVDLVHPDDVARTHARAAQDRDGVASAEFENRYRCKDGSYRWLSWKTQPFPSEQLVYATAYDITDRKLAEAAILKLNADLAAQTVQLTASNKELESFSYSVSHDLRAPLRAIDGYALMLDEDYGHRLDAEGHRLLRTVRDNAARMARLIDDLLAYSRLGRSAAAAADIDMQVLVQEVAAQLRRDRPESVAELRVAALPAAFGDRPLLRQVWANLLDNAFKYSSKLAAPVIQVSGHIEGGECIYCVEDNGAGFDMRYYDKLFGVFQRLHGADQFSGTGVGLAIVQRIVQRHGGRVWAESRPDHGARFYFALPIGKAAHG